eukprot:1639565-Heterocapsa_arctica.AAC.1
MPFVPGIAYWEWDEFDEIWGFDDVPRFIDDYGELVQAHLGRHVRGIPTGIEPEDMEQFFARVARMNGSRLERGHTMNQNRRYGSNNLGFLSVELLARARLAVALTSSTPTNAMEADIADGTALTETLSIAVDNLITLTNFEVPTTNMEMRIRVEELETEEEFSRCYPSKK